MDTTPSQPNKDEHSASSTTIKFDHLISLLRGPIPAGPHDDPSIGSYLLAFRSPKSWATAYKSCESKIISQCEDDARIGCAVSATNKCKPHWWQNLMGRKPIDLKERENCEVGEFADCFAVSKEKCAGFAKEKLLRPFGVARIAGRVSVKEVVKLICLASLPEKSTRKDLIGVDLLGSWILGGCDFGLTNYQAKELLGSDTNYERFLN